MICLIVDRWRNNVIGKNGQIPWKIKGEQKQFKEVIPFVDKMFITEVDIEVEDGDVQVRL